MIFPNKSIQYKLLHTIFKIFYLKLADNLDNDQFKHKFK